MYGKLLIWFFLDEIQPAVLCENEFNYQNKPETKALFALLRPSGYFGSKKFQIFLLDFREVKKLLLEILMEKIQPVV